MKPMDENEIWDSLDREPQPIVGLVMEAIEKARIGMIPEDEAIRIPPESEWPEHAKSVVLNYSIFETEEENEDDLWGLIKHISRSKPAWVPKVGDEVFAIWKDSISPNIFVGIVKTESIDNTVVTIGGSDRGFEVCNLKPFNPAYIGKPWSEIPEGRNGN